MLIALGSSTPFPSATFSISEMAFPLDRMVCALWEGKQDAWNWASAPTSTPRRPRNGPATARSCPKRVSVSPARSPRSPGSLRNRNRTRGTWA